MVRVWEIGIFDFQGVAVLGDGKVSRVWRRNRGSKAVNRIDIKKLETKVLDGLYPKSSGEINERF